MSSTTTTYAITGANKGIGRAITTLLLSRPATTIIALVRNPSDPTATSLADLPRGPGSTLRVVSLDAALDTASDPAAQLGSSLAGTGRIDVVIANAGASSGYRAVLATSPDDLAFDFAVNAVGPLRLFQAAWPLMKASPAAKFVLMSSSVASIAGQREESFPSTAYGMSKAAANWLLVKIGVEHGAQGLSVMALHPGWVKTAMGQGIADSVGVPEPPMTVEDSAKACVEQIDQLDKTNSGRFVSYTGDVLPW